MQREYELRLETVKAQIRNAEFLQNVSEQSEPLPTPRGTGKTACIGAVGFYRRRPKRDSLGQSRNGQNAHRHRLGAESLLTGLQGVFTTVHRLLTQLRESHSELSLRKIEAKFEKYDLVICDEFGYVSFDKKGAELLFNHLSLRTGRKATIITTNLSFDRWQEIFGDPVLTAALVDRITHKAHLVNMNGSHTELKKQKMMNIQ